jgi:hypothetical protein
MRPLAGLLDRFSMRGTRRQRSGMSLATVILGAILVAAAPAVSRAAAVQAGPPVTWNTVVDGPPGAWHRLARLSDGSWLRVLTTFPSPNRSELAVYRSTDNARTWTMVSTVGDGQRLVDNGFLYQAPNGDILLSARNNVLGSSYKISQWRSTSNGQTWSRESDVASVQGTKGLWEPYYYALADGRTVAMWADETFRGFSQVVVRRVSSDNGHTWGATSIVVSDGSNGRPGMPGVVRMTNGRYFMVFEVCGTRNCAVYAKTSADGVTWPGGVGANVPGQVCGPFVTSLTDGRLFVTSCRASDSNFATPVSYSNDFGVSWSVNTPAFTDAGQFGNWPALYQTATGEIAAVSGSRIRFGTVAPR